MLAECADLGAAEVPVGTKPAPALPLGLSPGLVIPCCETLLQCSWWNQGTAATQSLAEERR